MLPSNGLPLKGKLRVCNNANGFLNMHFSVIMSATRLSVIMSATITR